MHCLVPGDLPSTSPVLPGSVPKSSNKIAAASNSSQAKWAGQSKDGESNNTPATEHRALLVRVWGIRCGARKDGVLKEWLKETKAKRHTEGRR